MAETLRELVEAEKSLAVAAEWTLRGRRLEFVSPLEIEGLVEEGFLFRASALQPRPDQEVVFQLEYHGVRIPGGTGPLSRLNGTPCARTTTRVAVLWSSSSSISSRRTFTISKTIGMKGAGRC